MDNPAEASGGIPAAQKLASLEVRRILAPTDMSELSGKAVVYAVRLGLAPQAQVIALYVSEVFVDPTGSPVDLRTVSTGEVDGWRQEIKRRFDAYLDRFARIPDNVVRLVRASMDPWKEITAGFVGQVGVDLDSHRKVSYSDESRRRRVNDCWQTWEAVLGCDDPRKAEAKLSPTKFS